jgi:Plasmid encoded RepA protein
MSKKIIPLRPIDRKRLDSLQDRADSPLTHDNIGYVHTVLSQCFLPYKDPKTTLWQRSNGRYGILLAAGAIVDPRTGPVQLGLPYGAKPRLFQSYICTRAIKHQSRVIPVARSMSSMMHELGLDVSGGKNGTIPGFKDQMTRFARCRFDIVISDSQKQRYIKAEPIESFEVWFAPNPDQHSLWPSEIVLTEQFYQSLKDHAIPYDLSAMTEIQRNPRAIDTFLWLTQRLCRIPHNKPLLMRWKDLHELFGGESPIKAFKRDFPANLRAAQTCYPDARIEEHPEGYLFKASPPPVPKAQIFVPRGV